MKLEELLGAELYAQVQTKIDAANAGQEDKLKHIRYADLSEGEYVSKGKHESELEKLNNLLSGKTTELDTANNLIAELKKGTKGNEELQGKVTAYETQVAKLQEQLKQTQLDGEIKVALLSAKATDIDYLTYKLKAKGENLELGEDGHIKGIDDMISSLKTQFPNQFENGKGNGTHVEPNPLPSNNPKTSGVTKEQFDKMGYQSRLKLKQEQPEVYAQMTGKTTE